MPFTKSRFFSMALIVSLHVDAARSIKADVAMAEETADEIVRDERIDARGGRVLDEFSEALDGERARRRPGRRRP